MMSLSINLVFLVFPIFAFLPGTMTASLEAESVSELVSVKFYRMTQDGWASKESAFRADVATQANTYCSNSPSSCGLAEWLNSAQFQNTSVVVSTEMDLKDLMVKFYISFPTGANVSTTSQTQFVVNKVATAAMVTNIRADLEHIVGAYVTYIGDEYYGIPISNVANQVIIPIAFVVLIAVIVTALVLHFWNKRKSRRLHKKHKEINSSKVTPSHTNLEAMGKHANTHHNLKGNNVNNTVKESHQMQNFEHQNTTPRKRSNNEFTEVDETVPRPPPPSHLPSLLSEDADGDHKRDRKHKKKKKKKHRRQQSEETGNGQSDTENSRKHSTKSQEQTNRAFTEDNYEDSDYY